jgi:hypothetical protein
MQSRKAGDVAGTEIYAHYIQWLSLVKTAGVNTIYESLWDKELKN